MEFIQGLCRERPWQFKQAFDWASSGNSYPADTAAWDEIGPAQKAWFAAIKSGDEDTASENIKLNIAPVFLGMDWFHARAAVLGHTHEHTSSCNSNAMIKRHENVLKND